MATRKVSKKDLPAKPWHEILWVRVIGFITVLGAILTVIDTGTSLLDKFYKPIPKEFSIKLSPIRVHFQKNANFSIRERVSYDFQIQTYKVDDIPDSISLSGFKIENKKIVNLDSINDRSIQFYNHAYTATSDEFQFTIHELGCHFNVYFSLLPPVTAAKSGKVFDVGYAILTIPYYVNGIRKVKEEKIPIEIEVR